MITTLSDFTTPLLVGASASTLVSHLRASVAEAVVPQVAAVVEAQKNVSIGAGVTSTGLKEKCPAACSCVVTTGSAAKLPAFKENPTAPMPPNAPNGTV